MNDAAPGPTGAASAMRLLVLVPVVILAVAGLGLFPPPAEINGDTSWLITVVERLRAGERAYVDILETNPPMAFLVYWPAVATAALLGLPPETAVYLLTGAMALLCISLSAVIARRHLDIAGRDLRLFALVLGVTLLLVPSKTFTQREHLALLLLLPAVLTLSSRAAGARPMTSLALACGLLAGIGASIKPHFVLVVTLPAFIAAISTRSWRALIAPEVMAAALFCLAYAAVWVSVYGAYFDLPLLLTANSYRLYRYRPGDYVTDPPAMILLACVALCLAVMWVRRTSPAILAIGSAALAFAIAFVEQGKGFAYHLYPVAAMLLILTSAALAGRTGGKPAAGLHAAFIASAACAYLSLLYSANYPDSSGLKQAITRLKPRPSLIILTFDIAVNFPLARQIEATWASRLQSTWIGNSAGHALRRDLSAEQRERTLKAVALERRMFAEDIVRNRPDIIAFDRQQMLDHMRLGAEFRAAFDGRYAPAGTAQDGRFLLFRRMGE